MFLRKGATILAMAPSKAARRRELGRKVKERRLSLGMSKDTAAATARVSPVTWTRIETGDTVRELSYFGVSRALGWSPSAGVDFIERGVEPVAEEDLIGSIVATEGETTATIHGVLSELEGMAPAELSELIVRAAELIAQSKAADNNG